MLHVGCNIFSVFHQTCLSCIYGKEYLLLYFVGLFSETLKKHSCGVYLKGVCNAVIFSILERHVTSRYLRLDSFIAASRYLRLESIILKRSRIQTYGTNCFRQQICEEVWVSWTKQSIHSYKNDIQNFTYTKISFKVLYRIHHLLSSKSMPSLYPLLSVSTFKKHSMTNRRQINFSNLGLHLRQSFYFL